jgi:hypothetical protein
MPSKFFVAITAPVATGDTHTAPSGKMPRLVVVTSLLRRGCTKDLEILFQ